MTGQRRGSVIAATWLIGLGTLFLVREAANLSWGEAWPMFAILVGIASIVSALIGPRANRAGAWWGFAWPIAWIGIGVVLLLSTTGTLGAAPGELIGQYWPWLLIAVGIWFLIGAVFPRPADDTDRARAHGTRPDGTPPGA